METIIPRVKLTGIPGADIVDVLGASDEMLAIIGKKGIANTDGTRRGPLALDLTYMKAIQSHFKAKGRNPTDIELESIAQTWSEHCRHTIFADPIDEITDGLYRHYIKAATNKIRQLRGMDDICVSVFTDNAGAIVFDDDYLLTDKAETHNSPSALDPFGGAITGIVGVNRDAIGFGLGAKPIINGYGFCFGNPDDTRALYKGDEKTQRMLSTRRILEGVIDGVNSGGNCSGIPTNPGFMIIDDSYRGKPLVFVRTAGLIPRTSAGRPLHEKAAQKNDYIVVVGGRVGQDG
ncbi:MAG: AIR synthase related protein, partial [Acidobacteriota bacterium]